MSFWKCRGCEAYRHENISLRTQLSDAQAHIERLYAQIDRINQEWAEKHMAIANPIALRLLRSEAVQEIKEAAQKARRSDTRPPVPEDYQERLRMQRAIDRAVEKQAGESTRVDAQSADSSEPLAS